MMVHCNLISNLRGRIEAVNYWLMQGNNLTFNGWGSRIRTYPTWSRARRPTTRLFPSTLEL